MNSSLYTGVLGLQNHQTRMDVIGNNIANINTYGFKRGRATFADLLSRTFQGAAAPRNGRGGVNPLQVGMGMTTIAVTNIMTQGQMEMTGRLTDAAIDGNGWFILQDQSGDTVYTRDGAFGLDKQGGLVNANGWYVQGWSKVDVTQDHDFVVDTTKPVDQIKFQYGQKMEAAATSEVGLKCNLDVETRSLIADGIDPKEGFAQRSDLLVDLYDAVSSTSAQYSPEHLGLREGDWIEIHVQLTADAAGQTDLALTPRETSIYGYIQVTNDTDIGDLETALTNVLDSADVYGTQNIQAVFNEAEGRFDIYNYDTSGQSDKLEATVSLNAVSGSAIRKGFLLRESTYPTVTGTQLFLGAGGPGMSPEGEVVGNADFQTGQLELDYGNITGTPQVYGQLIQARLDQLYSAAMTTVGLVSTAAAGVFVTSARVDIDDWNGYTEGDTLKHIEGTQTLTIDGNVWHSVDRFSGAANEYVLTAGAGSTPSIWFATSNGLGPNTSAAMIFQFRPNSTAVILLSGAASAAAAGAYYLNKATGLLTLNWDNSAATAELSGATAFTGTVRFTSNYTTEDRALSAPAAIMYNRWADFAQEIATVALGGSGKGRTDFNNMFNGPGLMGSTLVTNQTGGGTAPYVSSLRLGSSYTYRTSSTVFDSLGDDHELQFIFTHVGSNYDIDKAKRFENRWYWRAELPYEDVFSFDSMDNINSTSVTTRLNGTLQFTDNGLIRKDLLNGNDGPIEFDPSPIGLNGVSTGALETVSILANFDGDDTDPENGILREGVTQMASPSTTTVFEQNGWEMGILETFSIDMQGVFEGRYSNNVVKPLAQIALAMFPNEEGLTKEGDNTFALSANSGLASVQAATVGARGQIVGGSLEQSNVDITTEFTNMIITERGFQANSRVITTSDEMLTEVLNLKR